MKKENKDQRRKQRKAKRAIRAAKRRVNVAPKAKPPQFEWDLPMTQTAIEDEIDKLIPQLNVETSGPVEYGEHGRTISLSPSMRRLTRLQKQLFRVVFGREPGSGDPLFWDRDRELEGAFPIDVRHGRQDVLRALDRIDIAPEIAYAVGMTGMLPFEGNVHLYKEEDLDEWHDAVDDYMHQAETGVPPLLPDELMRAVATSIEAAEQWAVSPADAQGPPMARLNRMVETLEAALGTRSKAAIALYRLSALGAITEESEFEHLLTPTSFSDAAMIAAASAEMDKSEKTFVRESFRQRLKVVLAELE